MNHLVNPLLLFADARIEAVHHAFNTRKTDTGPLLIALLIAVVVLGSIWLGIYLHKRYFCQPLLNPRKLFAQLCRAHQLTRTQRRSLDQLGEILKLPTPSVLMLDARLWQLEELLSSKRIDARKFEKLTTLQRTLYTDARVDVTTTA